MVLFLPKEISFELKHAPVVEGMLVKKVSFV
jgi:hypothetical protein